MGLSIFGTIIFLPAGTLRFWEGWAFFAVWFLPLLLFFLYFLKRDPALVERRMQAKEKVKEQRVLMKAVYSIFVIAFLFPGLDFRFGWTPRWVGAVPLWLKIVSLGMVLCGGVMTMWVMDVNRYASRTIQVEDGQTVVTTGPYKWVRHPMYFGILIMMLFAPVAQASYVALPVFALVIPGLVLRLRNEEKVLRQELPGYAEYCERTRYRLVPYVW